MFRTWVHGFGFDGVSLGVEPTTCPQCEKTLIARALHPNLGKAATLILLTWMAISDGIHMRSTRIYWEFGGSQECLRGNGRVQVFDRSF